MTAKSETIKREKNQTNCLVLDEVGNEITLEYQDLNDKYNINGLIRIQDKDYDFISGDNGYITHFNLNICHHRVGDIYALPRIKRGGFFDGKNEKLPLLSFKNIYICECIGVKEQLQYSDLKDSDFKYSFENIKTVKDLQKEIFYRYSKSMPHLSKKEILDLGVSITFLKILKKI